MFPLQAGPGKSRHSRHEIHHHFRMRAGVLRVRACATFRSVAPAVRIKVAGCAEKHFPDIALLVCVLVQREAKRQAAPRYCANHEDIPLHQAMKPARTGYKIKLTLLPLPKRDSSAARWRKVVRFFSARFFHGHADNKVRTPYRFAASASIQLQRLARPVLTAALFSVRSPPAACLPKR